MLEHAVTVVAVVLACTQPVPQIIRLVRTRSVAGVSGPTNWLGLVINAAWAAYGLARGLWPVAILSVAYVVGYLAVAALLVKGGNRRGIGTGLLAGAGLAALTAVGGWVVLGTVLALAVLVQFLPQVVEAWTSDDLTGLAAGTYVVSAVDGVVWGSYGFIATDGPLVLYGVIMCTVAALVLVPRVRWARRTTLEMEAA